MFLVSRAIAQKFTNLLDTFASYSGKAGYYLKVKSTEDGLEAAVLDAATKALSNLASVAINASLLFDTNNTYDLGEAAKNLRNIYSKIVTTPAVAFPATAVPSANANTLDDYEEGDWTAAFAADAGTITIDDNYKTGAYVKIGRMVTVTGFFLVAAVNSPVGTLMLTGLPFTCGNANKFTSGVVVGNPHNLQATAVTTLTGYVNPNYAFLVIRRYAAGVYSEMAADVKANSQFAICATYFTD